jgi:hypothetical protein
MKAQAAPSLAVKSELNDQQAAIHIFERQIHLPFRVIKDPRLGSCRPDVTRPWYRRGNAQEHDETVSDLADDFTLNCN